MTTLHYIWVGLLIGIGLVPGQVIAAFIFRLIMEKRMRRMNPKIIVEKIKEGSNG